MMTGPADVAALAARLDALSPRQRAELAHRLARRRHSGVPVRRAPGAGPAPASFLQERLWLVDQLMPASSAYVTTVAVRLRGAPDAARLRAALDVVFRRHDALRTGLSQVDGRLVQVVHDDLPLPWRELDLTGRDDAPAAVEQTVAELTAAGFALDRAPLMRALLMRTAPDESVLALLFHHAVVDGTAAGIVLAETGRAYAGQPLPPVALQYGDVAAWERDRLTGDRLDRLRDHWTRALDGAPPLLALPLDGDRARGGRQGAELAFALPSALGTRLRELCGRWHTSPFVAVYAALAATLARWSGQPDVVVGTPVSLRTAPELDGVVGPLVNSVPLRLRATGDTTFRDLLARAREVVADGRAHADLPFERLVEWLRPRRVPGANPVFQVNLGLTHFARGELRLPGVTAEPYAFGTPARSKFDLALYLLEDDGRWHGTVRYDAGLFRPATVRALAAALGELLGAAADDPDRPVGELPFTHLPETPAGAAGGAAADPIPSRAPVAPRDRWERSVAQAWTEVLGRTGIAATDNFFDLGGHSIAAMLALDTLARATGRRVALADMFARPTVEQLAALLRTTEAAVAEPLLVTLREGGAAPPLYLMHATAGELAIYVDLVRALGTGRPVRGVQSSGLFAAGADPGDPTMEQLAEVYAEALRREHPAGPVHLCGYSAGGRFAVAVAERLAAGGYPVGAVLALDTAPLGDLAPEPDLAAILARWLPFAPPAADLAGRDRAAQLEAVLAAGQRRGDLPAAMGLDDFTRLCRRLEVNARALAGYTRPAYRGTLTLLTWAGRRDRDLATEWRRFPLGGLTVVPAAVESHLAFVDGPGVHVVARLVEDRLRACEENLLP